MDEKQRLMYGLERLQKVPSSTYTRPSTAMEPGSGAGVSVSPMRLCLLWNRYHLSEKRMTLAVLCARHVNS